MIFASLANFAFAGVNAVVAASNWNSPFIWVAAIFGMVVNLTVAFLCWEER